MEACAGVNGSFAFGSHTPLGQEVQASLRVIEDENDFFSRYKVITFLRHPRSRIESGDQHIIPHPRVLAESEGPALAIV